MRTERVQNGEASPHPGLPFEEGGRNACRTHRPASFPHAPRYFFSAGASFAAAGGAGFAGSAAFFCAA